MESWVTVPKNSHFSIRNIPFGIFSTDDNPRHRPGIAIGEYIIDLQTLTELNGFSGLPNFDPSVFQSTTLNAFAALGRQAHIAVRIYLQQLLRLDSPFPDILSANKSAQNAVLVPQKTAKMHLPLHIGDYTDFYAGKNHAFNVGVLFRGAANALQPNYTHIPIGYHGRASSVVVSGTDIVRPKGEILENSMAEVKIPVFTASRKLDIELELAAFVSTGNKMGERIDVNKASDNIFGVVLMNDWSARDIQAWEYIPLGPFNSKNFGTSISPWVVLVDALEPFRTTPLPRPNELAPYLQEKKEKSVFDISLHVDINSAAGQSGTLTRTSASNLLYSFPQMLAHHTVSGCPMNTGDLLGSGTISGTSQGTLGSLLEATKNGKEKVKLADGFERGFLEDGDEVIISGVCGNEAEGLVGFGEVRGKILPARY